MQLSFHRDIDLKLVLDQVAGTSLVAEGSLRDDQNRKDVYVDMSSVTWSRPQGSLLLLRWLSYAKELGYRIIPNWGRFADLSRVYSKDEIDAKKGKEKQDPHDIWMYYQKFNGFRDAFDDPTAVENFRPVKHRVGRYIPYCRLDLSSAQNKKNDGNDGEARSECRVLASMLNQQFDVPAEAFEKSLIELFENIVFHAGPDARCYVMSQRNSLLTSDQERTRATYKVELALIDDGFGLFKTMREVAGVVDCATSIEAAVLPNVSTTGLDLRGYGLAVLLNASSDYHGEMNIGTSQNGNDGAIVKYDASSEYYLPLNRYPLPGTFIGLEIYPELLDIDAIQRNLKKTSSKNTGTLWERRRKQFPNRLSSKAVNK